MPENILILGVVVLLATLLFHPRLAHNRTWRAVITPLASIIGSGFLVIGPILDYSYGFLAPLVMVGLCLAAYLFGKAIRSNIAMLAGTLWPVGSAEYHLERVASWVLGFAYIISVAYYLNLFGAFAVSMTGVDDRFHARLVTSAVMLFLLFAGWTKGFAAMETLEQFSVSIKLAIIGGLLTGLVWFFASKASTGDLVLNTPPMSGWSNLTLALGLIITVQGFETSRYLGDDYDAATRIRSMRRAQWISSIIYVIYIGLITFLFPRGVLDLDETAIIELMEIVSPILPVILVAGALAAQFSAATADMAGSGGLFTELSRRRISANIVYALLAATCLVLTWAADIFEIISYASRAFALYYAIQSALAALAIWRRERRMQASAGYVLLALLGLAIFAFATPAESI